MTVAQKTLRVTDEKALELLGESKFLFGDNGGEADGPLWVPSQPIDEDEAAEVLKAGYGEMTLAFYYDNSDLDTIAELLKIKDVLHLARTEVIEWQEFAGAIEDIGKAGWAHFGAYDAGDEVWVIKYV